MYFDKGDEAAGLKALRKALVQGRKKSLPYSYVQLTRRECMARLLIHALENGIEEKYAQELIRGGRLVTEMSPVHVENWPWPLKIYTLGRFEIVRDGKPLLSAGRTQQKPLTLLKALIALGGRKVSESMLCDALWPDAEGDMQLQSLNTTLLRLRRLLDTPDAVFYQGGQLSLDTRYCWVDTWALERLLGEAETAWGDDESADRALPLSEKALHIYKGGFLPQHIDDSWVIDMQDRLKEKMLQAIFRAGRYLENADHWNQSIKWYRKALVIDPLVEECYQRLMICYQQLGRKADGVSIYHRCCKILDTKLGMEPSNDTENIYQKLNP
jgi:DNA-binding SARP family transcriptional activator